MEEKRRKRYMKKLELIMKRAGEIEEWKSGFFMKEKDRLAVYKAFQEIGEACMDIITMILKDSGKIPEDDYIKRLSVSGKRCSWCVNLWFLCKKRNNTPF